MPFSIKQGDDFPLTTQLLTEGGDDRIRLDRHSGLNKYGCRPYPDVNLLALGSSTATTISPVGFAAAEALREKMVRTAEKPGYARYTQEYERLRQELRALCGIVDLPGVDIVFAASGTDAHLIAAQITDHAGVAPMCAVMVEADETGSGVAAALAGRHFSSRTALCASVTESAQFTPRAVAVRVVAIRAANGYPRSAADIDGDVVGIVAAAIASGQRVFLTLIDVSKTGLIAPSPACVAQLCLSYAGQMTVLVDACQGRIAPATLRAYLGCGYMVAMTGSKFMTGPSFSGALFLPAGAQQYDSLPTSLNAYSARAEWPEKWRDSHMSDVANSGLLLRWEAALTEMKAFYALPEYQIYQFMHRFAESILQRLHSVEVFQLLPTLALNRYPLSVEPSWDTVPSIFSFLLYHAGADRSGRVPLSREETMFVYRQLQCDLSGQVTQLEQHDIVALAAKRYQLGQPVLCGSVYDRPVSALRLCLSARLVGAALAPMGIGEAGVIGQALGALDKIAWLIRRMR